MWLTKKVLRTYSTHNSQNAWAYLQDVGWRKIKTGAVDGVTNIFMMMNNARAHDRTVTVYVDAANQITTAYLN